MLVSSDHQVPKFGPKVKIYCQVFESGNANSQTFRKSEHQAAFGLFIYICTIRLRLVKVVEVLRIQKAISYLRSRESKVRKVAGVAHEPQN